MKVVSRKEFELLGIEEFFGAYQLHSTPDNRYYLRLSAFDGSTITDEERYPAIDVIFSESFPVQLPYFQFRITPNLDFRIVAVVLKSFHERFGAAGVLDGELNTELRTIGASLSTPLETSHLLESLPARQYENNLASIVAKLKELRTCYRHLAEVCHVLIWERSKAVVDEENLVGELDEFVVRLSELLHFLRETPATADRELLAKFLDDLGIEDSEIKKSAVVGLEFLSSQFVDLVSDLLHLYKQVWIGKSIVNKRYGGCGVLNPLSRYTVVVKQIDRPSANATQKRMKEMQVKNEDLKKAVIECAQEIILSTKPGSRDRYKTPRLNASSTLIAAVKSRNLTKEHAGSAGNFKRWLSEAIKSGKLIF